MKSINKLLRIVAVAAILSRLIAALPATPAFAAEKIVQLDPEEGAISVSIAVTGEGFNRSSDNVKTRVLIYFSPEELNEGDEMRDLDTHHRVQTKITDSSGNIDTYFDVPSRLSTGDEDEDVHVGTYYVYTTYSPTGKILTKNEFTVIASEIEPDPEDGAVGTSVDITGKEFNYDEPITVFWDDNEIDIESGDDKTDGDGEFALTIIIPKSINGEHTIKVTDESDFEAEATFTVEAEITIDPAEGAPGDRATVKGTGFGDEVKVSIEFNGDEVATAGTDDEGSFEVSFVVPVTSPDTYNIEAKDTDRNEASKNFIVAARLELGQTAGHVGSQVTIKGGNFIPNATVTINYDAQSVTSAATDGNGEFSVSFTVPQSQHGTHAITASDGRSSATASFIMESTPPSVVQPRLPFEGTKVKSRAFFDWDDVKDDSGITYTLQIALDNRFTPDTILLEKTELTESEYTLTREEKLQSADKENPYYWWVRAIDGAGNESDWTNPASFNVGFTLDMSSGWIRYTLIGLGGLLLLFIGYLLYRRFVYY
jgi:hypothetical protein